MVLVGVDGVVMATVMVLFFAGVVGVSHVVVDNLDHVIVHQSMWMPDFGYDGPGRGNTLFEVYSQLRWAAVAVLFCGILFYVFRGLYDNLRGVCKIILLCVLLFAFPPVWDVSVYVVTMAGLWILNPLYAFDQSNPCPAQWGEKDIMRHSQESPYYTGDNIHGNACMPSHRVSYVVQQVGGITDIEPHNQSALSFVDMAIYGNLDWWLVNMFGVLTKAIILINLGLMVVVAGVMLDMFTGLAIGSVPVWVMLHMVPRFRRISDVFLCSVPCILVVPIFSGMVLVVGSSAVASGGHYGLLGVWLSAVAVLFFVATMPVLLVPVIGGAVHRSADAILQGTAAGVAMLYDGILSARQNRRNSLRIYGGVIGKLDGLAKP